MFLSGGVFWPHNKLHYLADREQLGGWNKYFCVGIYKSIARHFARHFARHGNGKSNDQLRL